MELWWRLRGWARVRLTSADCVDRLQAFSREMRLEQIAFASPLEAEFTMLRADVKKLNAHDGEKLEVIRAGGFPSVLDSMRRWWILMFLVVLLVMLTVFLSGRILFFRVEGNGDVPARLILEQVEDCGVRFGASARELRSEQVKNHLLWAIPELRWAGVNIRGCTATITVALRQSGQEPADECPGDVVAVVDAVVTEVYPQSGTAQVSPGQAVREGEVLISGTTDLGLCTRVERAEGEVYGLSRREVKAVLPSETAVRQESSRVIRKFSLRIGKKG